MQSNLNEKQKEAVELGLGPAMILAGPGSGKTTVLLYRIKYLIDELHISPKNILVITFTKAAAQEMHKRAESILKFSKEKPFFGTFHSYFYSILKRSYEYREFSIMTNKNKFSSLERLLQTNYPNIRISNILLNEILNCFSKKKNQAECQKDILNLGFTLEEYEELQSLYDHFNRENGYMDYDDILLYAKKLLEENTQLLATLQREVQYILVDEFQDVNLIQYELISLLAGKNGNLFVVGDDDQSIYRFRGAGEENLRQFETDFSKAKKVTLDVNYRCPGEIVEMSSRLIKNNQKRFLKELYSGKKEQGLIICKRLMSKEEERNYIINKIKEIVIAGEKDAVAVLCRTNSQLSYFTERLRKEKIDFYMKEKRVKFYNGAYVKPIIGYLMFASKVDRSRRRLFTFLNQPVRYIKREIFANWEESWICGDIEMEKRLNKLWDILERIQKMPPKIAINYILKLVGYEVFILEKCTSAEEIMKFRSDMEELKSRAMMYDSIRQWMEYVKVEEDMEDSDVAEMEHKNVQVFLYTFHGAKGLEFEHVFIPHLNEGSIPYGKNISQDEVEEERRMFYVALTRSSKNLEITFVENDTKKDTVSRFLKECAFTVSK